MFGYGNLHELSLLDRPDDKLADKENREVENRRTAAVQ